LIEILAEGRRAVGAQRGERRGGTQTAAGEYCTVVAAGRRDRVAAGRRAVDDERDHGALPSAHAFGRAGDGGARARGWTTRDGGARAVVASQRHNADGCTRVARRRARW